MTLEQAGRHLAGQTQTSDHDGYRVLRRDNEEGLREESAWHTLRDGRCFQRHCAGERAEGGCREALWTSRRKDDRRADSGPPVQSVSSLSLCIASPRLTLPRPS